MGIKANQGDAGAASAALQDPFYKILTYTRSDKEKIGPENLPELSKEQWRAWAARLYAKQLETHKKPPVQSQGAALSEAAVEANKKFHEWTKRGMRMMAAGLFARAVQREWPKVAQRWADTYWKLQQEDGAEDSKEILERARVAVLKKEHIERAWKLDETQGGAI